MDNGQFLLDNNIDAPIPREDIRTKVTGDEFVSGFALTGEYVKGKLADKSFTIVGQRTEIMPDLNGQGSKKKTILTVRLADGAILDYYPNKTAMKSIINKLGFKLQDWIGYKGVFYTSQQRIAGNIREVIYIVE